jgi:hypothetical protein
MKNQKGVEVLLNPTLLLPGVTGNRYMSPICQHFGISQVAPNMYPAKSLFLTLFREVKNGKSD